LIFNANREQAMRVPFLYDELARRYGRISVTVIR
jgi:hypothetical protein